MFKVGDYIVHGRNGVCKVVDITHLDMSGVDKDQLYYALVPMKSEDSKIFYPVDSDKVVMRSVVTKDQAKDLVSEIKDIEPMRIENSQLPCQGSQIGEVSERTPHASLFLYPWLQGQLK